MNKFFTLALLFITSHVFCQVGGMSVSPNGSQPDASAGLDINFNNKGLLMPRMSTVQRNAIASPATGLFIFNTDCQVVNYNAGTPSNPNWATINASNVLVAGVTIAANPIGAICAGASVTFTATPSNGINSPSYQWQVNGNNVGTNSTTYSSSTLNNGDVVTCILSSNAACVTGSPVTSNPITMLVNIVPTITGTTAASFCSGSAVTLGASANLGTINWYANSTGGSSLLSGASFTTSGLTSSTTFYVDATANGCISPTRTAVTATFFPNVPAQPGAISGLTTLHKNDTATYSISPQANTSLYNWIITGGIITSGQGTTSILVTWGDSSVFGGVSVAATNPCGSSAAQAIVVNVDITTFFATDSLLYGSIQTFNVPAGVTSLVVDAFGAQGGSGNGGYGSLGGICNCSLPGGMGAEIRGTVAVSPGDVIKILVGQAGGGYGGGQGNQNGGGGGSFVVDQTTNTLLVVAGGGGGGPSTQYGVSCSRTPTDGNGQIVTTGATPTCPQCGCSNTGGSGGSGGNNNNGSYAGGGGGGYTGNGGNGTTWCSPSYGGQSYTNGGAGGIGATCDDPSGTNTSGGFGGGGGGGLGGPGGGGGYSGGGTMGSWSSYSSWGGGGGSYNSGTNQANFSGVRTGHGKVIIGW